MKRIDGLFIAGTDTGVGKTVVTAALVAALRDAGEPAVPMKPVQTGADNGRSPDLDFSLRAADCEVEHDLYDLLSPCRLGAPVSPHFAARLEDRRVDLAHLLRAHAELRRRGLVTIVEGAGGLLVPLDDEHFLVDLVEDLELPALLVARPSLGTLNHTLLSAAELNARGIALAGVVLNDQAGAWDAVEENNLLTLQQWLPDVPVVRFPHLDPNDRKALLRAGRKALDALLHT